MVAQHENSALAQQLFREAIQRYNVDPDSLTVHQDRGAPMTSHGFAAVLSQLGVDRSYSRPRVSNDNPFSEAAFRTVKSQPDYPGRFRDVEHARQWMSEFFAWYNTNHHHDALALFTPEQVFVGRVNELAERRQAALNAAFDRTPQRFVFGRPAAAQPPQRVLLNPLDAAPPTAATLLESDERTLLELFPARSEDIPIIHLPGAALTQNETLNAT
jgi:putative transposase